LPENNIDYTTDPNVLEDLRMHGRHVCNKTATLSRIYILNSQCKVKTCAMHVEMNPLLSKSVLNRKVT